MGDIITILIFAALGAVLITLGVGVWSMYRGGAEAASRSNKLMRLRVALQALAIVLLCVGMWWKSTQGS